MSMVSVNFEDDVVSENVCVSFHSGSVNGKSITIFLSLILIPFRDACANLAFVDSTKKDKCKPHGLLLDSFFQYFDLAKLAEV